MQALIGEGGLLNTKKVPTQEYLKSKFVLDEESGWLIWLHDPNQKANWNAAWTGSVAGCIKGRHVIVCIDGEQYLAHRLIWMYLYGYDPIDIDHRDGNGCNNQPDNLREATQAQNTANADWGEYRGIEAHGAKFRVRIFVDGVRLSFGSYNTLGEAKIAADAAYTKHYGEFAFCNRPH